MTVGRPRGRRVRRAAAYRFALLLASAAVAALVLTACGGSSSNGGAGNSTETAEAKAVSAAKAALVTAEGPVPWNSPGPSFDASAARGKSVAYIPIDGTIPFTSGLYSGFKSAMTAVGVKPVFFDTNGTPPGWAEAVDESIGEKVGAIVLQGEDPGEIAPAIAAANAAHIPVIESFIHSAGQPISPGTVAEATYSVPNIGKEMADYAIAAGGGKVNSVAIGTDSPVSTLQLAAIKAEFAKLCPATCKVEATYQSPTTEWATQLPTLTPSILLSHPDLNFMFPLTDGMVQYMVPALKAENKASSIKLISFNATPGVMSNMTQSDHVLAADVGNPLGWAGYILADQALRALTGKAPVPSADEQVPLRLFTPTNFSSSELNTNPDTWFGSTDYASEYQKLWGVG
jgi:ribose transport system substrate-binding protein